MADVTKKAFDLLMPPGYAWRAYGNLALLYEALALSLERVREYLRGVLIEAIPKTSVSLLEDWHTVLGLAYDEAQTTEEKQSRVDAAYTSTGGGAYDYLTAQVKREFPDIYIVEVDLYNYDIKGQVSTVRDYVRLLNFVDRIFPLHLVPGYDVRIVETLDVAVTGLAITGKAITGKELVE